MTNKRIVEWNNANDGECQTNHSHFFGDKKKKMIVKHLHGKQTPNKFSGIYLFFIIH